MEALVAFLALGLAPHALRLPAWIVGLVLLSWTYAILGPRSGWPRLPRWLLQAVTLLAVGIALLFPAGAAGENRTLAGGVAVLAVVMGLKPLESVSRRDYIAATMLGLFLVLSNLLYTESLGMAGYLLAASLGACMQFIHLVRPQERLRHVLRQAAGLLLQGAPFMLVLFFLFPRMPSGIFGLPANAVPTGFDDNMTPGAISHLVTDETLVFRAEFDTGQLPPAAQRYWRGLTLWHFDGRSWVRGREVEHIRTRLAGSQPVSYSIILEPMHTRWLFALDKPARAPEMHPLFGVMHQDRTLRARKPVTQRRQYRVESFLQSRDPVTQEDRKAGLQLPPRGNPRARALGVQLAREHPNPAARVQAMLQHFRDDAFHYTLSPPTLGPDPVDDFLFSQKRGFCEHYASAMAFTMRAAGVPARVTLGYLGGLVNPVGGHVEVRQAEAHAWTEVALPELGWVRVDPTAAVAPERVHAGLEAALGAEDLQRYFHHNTSIFGNWPLLRHSLATISYKWYSLVLSYGSARQGQLLRQLGLDLKSLRGWLGLAALLAVLLGAAVLLVLFWQRRLQQTVAAREDAAATQYRTFCRRLAAAGLPRPPTMGPQAYGRHIAAARPDLMAEAQAILACYTALRYERLSDVQREPLLQELAALVRRFRPRPARAPRHAAAGGPETGADPAD
ncbi:hypothetical protein DGI_0729 [Megalodesulfovibrio gigas DSM 1382 = ATCC 19364]|uniref:Transglutaminase-like domain-containing protein n=2 Tax=Megalodesulfovibrio gigas TaxID=879 RepID=T2G939_MEGG1|nr:hypothetical protein DGI_0729 [Megalodesulfovibrio gigas DSM 1382 = ATCC 19364]